MNETKRRSVYVGLVTAVAALGGLLFGYDTAVISGGIGFLRTCFQLNAAETGWAASSALVGCIFGAGIAGAASDRLGRRGALMVSAVLFALSGLGTALPRTLPEFITARIAGGVGIGMASMLSPLYIAEVSPAAIRGRLVSFNQLAIVSGILIVYFVNYFIASLGSESWNVQVGWRWMFGSEALPAFVFFGLLVFVPESPRWLATQKREKEAHEILVRIGGYDFASTELTAIRDATSRESGSIALLFQPGLRRILVLGVVLAILQQVTGINVFMYYAPEIFKQLGAEIQAALFETIIVGAVNLAFTLVAIRTVDRLGRKPLMIVGAAGMGSSLFAIGYAAYHQAMELWVLLFILLYIACFALSLGPVVWVVLSEIFPMQIRGRAMAIATLLLWTANYVVSQTFPMLNENAWLAEHFHHAFPFWLYGAMCVATVLYVWRFLPETKGKTLEEIERLWLRKR